MTTIFDDESQYSLLIPLIIWQFFIADRFFSLHILFVHCCFRSFTFQGSRICCMMIQQNTIDKHMS
ncbi:hypothetical protein BCR44DRAFT_1426303 [Catenaria anguillulae PL171]|uniref:Uncharacterized protein n=1 Tax=Catenaria anguillulae PL171 TaxID=765915 RepID=A0A1Y2HXF8_9FUNG|nr:hypothetical protein BCR44DRAFT_1426303 [Catenaria anguillulae PL171]